MVYNYLNRTNNTKFAPKTTSESKIREVYNKSKFTQEEFYKPYNNLILFFRLFLFLLFSLSALLEFLSPKLTRTNDFYSVLINLNLYKRDVTRNVVKFVKTHNVLVDPVIFLKEKTDDLLNLLEPYHPDYVSLVYKHNTLNQWILFEWFINTTCDLFTLFKAKFGPRYCTNMVHSSLFHYRDSKFTKNELDKLYKTPEYQRLKAKRFGQGTEAWNWQLRRSSTNYAKQLGLSHVYNEFNSDEE